MHAPGAEVTSARSCVSASLFQVWVENVDREIGIWPDDSSLTIVRPCPNGTVQVQTVTLADLWVGASRFGHLTVFPGDLVILPKLPPTSER